MVPPAELGADAQERHVGLLAHQEHRDLTGHDDRLVAFLALQGVHGHAVVVRHGLGDPLGVTWRFFGLYRTFERTAWASSIEIGIAPIEA